MKPFPYRFFSLKGFTLVELVVSIGILFAITTVLLAKYPETAVRLSLANSSHELSLLIREAQVRGSAIDSVNSSLGGYGVFISFTASDRFILFGDTVDPSVPKPYGISVGNELFENGTPIDETKSIISLPSRYSVAKLCVGAGFPFVCNTNSDPDIQTLTISFTRPEPNPSIYVNGDKAVDYTGACIELHSPQAPGVGHIRNVQVFSSGMIRTGVGSCDNNS